ncbi:MAG: hypothetical protein H6Q14_994 [Bacteroidetes bacterium]|nr:hypothetical protein [Bacteroidota bacterium]
MPSCRAMHNKLATYCNPSTAKINYNKMKKIKRINLKGISEILSEKELKNVIGGSGSGSGCTGCSSGEKCINSWGLVVSCAVGRNGCACP